MNDELKQKLKTFFAVKGNVWLTVLATLLVLGSVTMVYAATTGSLLFSSAGGRVPKVRLVDGTEAQYAPSIDVQAGQTIQVAWRGYLVSSCASSGWAGFTDINIKPVKVGPFSAPKTTLSVTCTGKYGTATATLDIYTNATSTGSTSSFVSPKKDDHWVLGKTYVIQWNNGPAVSPPAGQPDCKIDTLCPPGNPPAGGLTVQSLTLNRPPPACLSGPGPRCLPPTRAPYTIICDQQTANTCTWTIPTSLDSWFLGEENITVTFAGEGPDGITPSAITSDGFTITPPSTEPPRSDGSLQVISPNGGEIWQLGSTQVIKWSGGSGAKQVNITLDEYMDCSPPRACPARMTREYQIANATANDGSFSWNVGTGITTDIPAGQYMLTITDTSGKYYDTSDSSFSIAGKTGISPAPGGEAFTLKLSDSRTLAAHSDITVTYSKYLPVACTQLYPGPNCTGDVTVTVGKQLFVFQQPGDVQTIAPGVTLTMTSVVRGGLTASFLAK